MFHLSAKMSSPKPTTDIASPAVQYDHRLGTKGKTKVKLK